MAATIDADETFYRGISKLLFQSPARISILGFLILIAIGTTLLMLPSATTNDRLGFVNALFTSTSAACVTGLVVVDTGLALSTFGQFVVLVLIQVGGLGIMTLSTLFLLAAGRRPSLSGRLVIKDAFTQSGDRSFRSVLHDVALFTCIFEGIGMLLMFLRFLPDGNVIQALYLSLFHSVSAFCNAGFSLFTNSFIPYQGDLLLNLVLSFLIISGGIGFLVLSELKRQFPVNRRTWSRLSLHTKMVLTVSFTLLFSGSLLILVTEWHNTLAPLSVPSRFLAGVFQAVTARTAGFNTLSIGDLANETLFLLILLMFIGASPGSCGGGIKTTTLGSLIALGFSRLRGHDLPQVFYRTISQESVGKAISIVILSMAVVTFGTMVLLATELGDIAHPQSRGKFLELLFEVVSAFGTVGLSTGVTPGLSAAGKLVITMVMFLGRLGPLVVAVAVSRGSSRRYQYAEEGIMVG